MAYGNDSNTVLLIHSNNANGSQLFADASQAGNGGNRHALTVVGDIAHSTVTTKPNLGNSTVSCNTSGYLSIPAHADFNYGSENFTIDLWFYAYALTGLFNIGLVSQYVDANNQFALELNGTSLRFNTKANGTSLLNQSYLTASLLNIETWYHAAVVRNGGQVTLYLNGVQRDTATIVTNPPQYNAPLLVGKKASSTFGGHWTELRISKGVARTDFPVTFPYTSANYTVAITSPSASVVTPQILGSNLTASTDTAITLDTTAFTASQVTTSTDSVANLSNTDLSTKVDLSGDSVAVVTPTAVISTVIDLTTEPVFALAIESIGQQVDTSFPSTNAIAISAIAEGNIDSNFSSLVAIQNSAPLPIDFNLAVRMAGDLPLQVVVATSFSLGITVTPIISPTLAYTSRQNIVLKIKEGLHGGVTIGGINYEVTQVEGTTDFRGLLTEDQVSGTNAIFVAHSQTRASENQVLGLNTRQQVEDYFAVFLVTDNNSDEYGINAMDIIRAIHRRVLDALLNWQLPPTQYDLPTMPLIYRGGNAYGLESDSYYWRDDYSCTSQICRLQAQPMF